LGNFVIISSLDGVRDIHIGAKIGMNASIDLSEDKIEFGGSVLRHNKLVIAVWDKFKNLGVPVLGAQ
jgi:hypothetical protein